MLHLLPASLMIDRHEKTKAVVKLQKRGAGAPSREPVVDSETQKAMMAWHYKKQEEQKVGMGEVRAWNMRTWLTMCGYKVVVAMALQVQVAWVLCLLRAGCIMDYPWIMNVPTPVSGLTSIAVGLHCWTVFVLAIAGVHMK